MTGSGDVSRCCRKNVLEAVTEPPDIVSAMNFSYWLLQDRKLLSQYFQSVWRAPARRHLFPMPGGYDSHKGDHRGT